MNRALVAYFSASAARATKKLAEQLAGVVNGDLYEIAPVVPYTSADLNWNNRSSRSTLEMHDKGSRPAIGSSAVDVSPYQVVFVGFPIWWNVAPTIINTFLENHALAGKTIIPFATSGGSGMGNTNQALRDSCRGATLKAGKCFPAGTDDKTLARWVEDLKL